MSIDDALWGDSKLALTDDGLVVVPNGEDDFDVEPYYEHWFENGVRHINVWESGHEARYKFYDGVMYEIEDTLF